MTTDDAQYTLIIYALVFEKDENIDAPARPEQYHEQQIKIVATLDDLNALLNNNATAQTVKQMALRCVQAARRQQYDEAATKKH
jgi:hypothetical protein